MLWTIRSFGCLLSEAEATSECDEQAEHLTRLLSALSSEEIYAFDRHFAKRRIEAYRWDLWGQRISSAVAARMMGSSIFAAG